MFVKAGFHYRMSTRITQKQEDIQPRSQGPGKARSFYILTWAFITLFTLSFVVFYYVLLQYLILRPQAAIKASWFRVLVL